MSTVNATIYDTMLPASAGTGFDSLPSHHQFSVTTMRKQKSYLMRKGCHLATWLSSSNSVAALSPLRAQNVVPQYLNTAAAKSCTNVTLETQTNTKLLCLAHRSNVSLSYARTLALRNITLKKESCSISDREKHLAFLSSTSVANLATSSTGTTGPFPVGKTAEVWFWSIIFTSTDNLQCLTKDTAGTLWKSRLRKTSAIIGRHCPLHSFHISPFYFIYIHFNIILVCTKSLLPSRFTMNIM